MHSAFDGKVNVDVDAGMDAEFFIILADVEYIADLTFACLIRSSYHPSA